MTADKETERICALCGLRVPDIPRWRRGECPGELQHEFLTLAQARREGLLPQRKQGRLMFEGSAR